MHYDAFKCTLKELTTKSVFNARGLWSFGMRMPSYLLHPSLDSDQVDQFSFMLCCPCHKVSFSHSAPPPSLPMVLFPLIFVSMTGACLLSLFFRGTFLSCAVVPAMGGCSFYRLAAKSESPWILQAPNLRLAMQLLTKLFSKLDIKFMWKRPC